MHHLRHLVHAVLRGEPRLLKFVRLVLGVARQLHEIEVRLGLPQPHLERLHQVRAGQVLSDGGSSRAAASRATSCPAASRTARRPTCPAAPSCTTLASCCSRNATCGAGPRDGRRADDHPQQRRRDARPRFRHRRLRQRLGGGGGRHGGVRRPHARPLGLRLLQPPRRRPRRQPAAARRHLPHVDDVAVRPPLVAAAAQRHRPRRVLRSDAPGGARRARAAQHVVRRPPPPPRPVGAELWVRGRVLRRGLGAQRGAVARVRGFHGGRGRRGRSA